MNFMKIVLMHFDDIGPLKNESDNFFCVFSSFSWFFMIKFGEKMTEVF